MTTKFTLCALAAGWALCAQAQPYILNWQTLSAGGGFRTDALYTIHSTIGQPFIGGVSAESRTLISGFWSVLGEVPAPGLPRLAIVQAGRWVIVSWPATAANYILQSTDTLGEGATWAKMEVDYQTVEDRIQASFPVERLPRFFRLSLD